jgi:class 3 adenylate cyclase/CHASE2 domain-containing sensor protein
VKLKPFRRIPVLIAFGVIALVCLARWARLDFFERFERMTFDMRARQAATFSTAVATNLGFVYLDEETVDQVWNGSLGFRFGLYWPRQVYGRLVNELNAQGARAVAFDVIFGELRPDHAPVQMTDGRLVESDEFFAAQMRRASNVLLAVTRDLTPPDLFLTNALAPGEITTEKDADGILRRVQICRLSTNWHAAFRQMEASREYGVSLERVRFETNCLVLVRPELGDIRVPLDKEGRFDLTDLAGDSLPPGMDRMAKPFTIERIWHMGVQLAAQELKLDLAGAEVDLNHGRILLRGPNGLERIIPVDSRGYALIDWSLPPNHPKLTQESMQRLLLQNRLRLEGRASGLTNRWRGKLAVVGSSALVGNNLTDRGATPLSPETILVSKHWNVANSLITGRFVQRSPLLLDLGLIVLLGVVAGLLSWRLGVLWASLSVVLLALVYTVFAIVLYLQTRYWLPLVLPVGGAMLMNYALIVTWRAVFEQAERRRVRAVLSTIVSPKIANVLLQVEKLSLGGARREITVLFSDVRGFTEFTETAQERAAEFVRENKLSGQEAEAHFDEQAREAIATVNLYLGLVADTVLRHDGTLDKFIGDCVMAFWGAPNPEPHHALACVRAAIEAQRGIAELNRQRARENEERLREHQRRAAAGLRPQPLLPVLTLGTGINTGSATVGMMGSEVKQIVRQGNYTIFGREVNLASRLEALSGSARIFISEATYQHLRREDPALAATCLPQPLARVKGINAPVQVYEVPWQRPGESPISNTPPG